MTKRNETLEWLKAVEPIARSLRTNSPEKKEVSIHDGYIPKGMGAVDVNEGVTMLINDVLEPLIRILYSYKDSHNFACIPGTNTDTDAGWNYFDNKFNEVYAGLNKNIYISWHMYVKVLRIIREVQCFVRECSNAEGLVERFYRENPNLKYYRIAFELREENEEAYTYAAENGFLSYVPTEAEFEDCEEYFANTLELANEYNCNYSKEDYFIHEVVYALRLRFQKTVFIELLR